MEIATSKRGFERYWSYFILRYCPLSVYAADKSNDEAQLHAEGGGVSNLELLYYISTHFYLNIALNKQL